MTLEILLSLLAATVQAGTPILYATLGEMLTEKAGVLNLGVEGMMLVGALAAFLGSYYSGSPWVGLAVGGIGGAMLASVHALVCLVFQGNQVVSGLALTILGTGLANFLGTPFIGQASPGFYAFELPLLHLIPVLGRVLFSHDIMVYGSFLLPVLLWLLLQRTRWGLRIRAVGEYPEAAAAAGVRVVLYRFAAIAAGGFLVGLGGAYLSLAYTHLWTSGLTAGRGWIAVALVIFAFWRPGRAVLGAYLFGGVMAFQLRLQAMGADIPSSLLLMLPYGLTILVLVLSSWRRARLQAPAWLGVNIEPGE